MGGARQRDLTPPVEAALDAVRKRWKASVILELDDTNLRFGELHSRLPNVAHKILTEVLRELEADGLLVRNARPGRTRYVEYALTASGAAMLPILHALRAWRTEQPF